MKPLSKLEGTFPAQSGVILTTKVVACLRRKVVPELGQRRWREVLHTTNEELEGDVP